MNADIVSMCVEESCGVSTPRHLVKWWDGSVDDGQRLLLQAFEEEEKEDADEDQDQDVNVEKEMKWMIPLLHSVAEDEEVEGIRFHHFGRVWLHLKKRFHNHSNMKSTVMADREEMETICEVIETVQGQTRRRWWKISAAVAVASALVGFFWGRKK